MSHKINAYLITCLTNLHAGSGGTNYGVVDNLVQRDPISNMPTIHSSSLKGALREFFKSKWGEDEKLDHVFGPDGERKESNKDKSGIGHFKFFTADLLVLPVRSNKQQFFRGTSPMLVSTINSKFKAFTGKDLLKSVAEASEKQPLIAAGNGIKLEDFDATIKADAANDVHLGENWAVFNDNDFKRIVKSLPVIARNKLDNGISANLWYEEVVPRESRFVLLVAMDDKYNKEFNDTLKGAVVQIGANAPIGYGYCSIENIYSDER